MSMKILEVRDEGTFIPVLAFRFDPSNEAERYLLAMAGYGRSVEEQQNYVLLTMINGGRGETHCDPYEWAGSRTMGIAHDYLENNWDNIQPGDVVDISFILGETKEPKSSQRLEM